MIRLKTQVALCFLIRRAQTSIKLLGREERIEEAARILGGINVTEAQRAAARDMIDNINE